MSSTISPSYDSLLDLANERLSDTNITVNHATGEVQVKDAAGSVTAAHKNIGTYLDEVIAKNSTNIMSLVAKKPGTVIMKEANIEKVVDEIKTNASIRDQLITAYAGSGKTFNDITATDIILDGGESINIVQMIEQLYLRGVIEITSLMGIETRILAGKKIQIQNAIRHKENQTTLSNLYISTVCDEAMIPPDYTCTYVYHGTNLTISYDSSKYQFEAEYMTKDGQKRVTGTNNQIIHTLVSDSAPEVAKPEKAHKELSIAAKESDIIDFMTEVRGTKTKTGTLRMTHGTYEFSEKMIQMTVTVNGHPENWKEKDIPKKILEREKHEEKKRPAGMKEVSKDTHVEKDTRQKEKKKKKEKAPEKHTEKDKKEGWMTKIRHGLSEVFGGIWKPTKQIAKSGAKATAIAAGAGAVLGVGALFGSSFLGAGIVPVATTVFFGSLGWDMIRHLTKKEEKKEEHKKDTHHH